LKKILQKFNINGDTKFVSIPLTPHFKLKSTMSSTTAEEHEYMSHISYASVVYNLMYAMMCTRLDLSQAVSIVSRYMHDPGKGYWEAMKWIIQYIKGTIDLGLMFEKDTTDK